MVNSEDFSKRLQRIINYYDISAASFADTIEVGRSSISHILSGRNKPSLDFVLKIVQAYPEVELYWLLNGKGSFPNLPDKQKEEKQSRESPAPVSASNPKTASLQQEPSAGTLHPDTGKKIRKIVIFYADGSFEAFEN